MIAKMVKKIVLFLSGITILYVFIWLTTFEGLMKIRYSCYKIRLCYPLSQILEKHKLYRLPTLTSIFDPFFLAVPTPPSSLPIYQLSVDPQDYQSIADDLPPPYSVQFNTTASKKIPGRLVIDNQDYQIELNFRGIGYHHWSETKKSLRVSFVDPPDYHGRERLDLIIPADPDFYGFHLNKWGADRLNLHTNNPDLIHLYINQIDFGPYVMLDVWDQDFLETRSLPNGLIFGDVDPAPDRPDLYRSIEAWKTYDPPADEVDYSAIESLLNALNLPDIPESITRLKQVIDIDSFAKWEALTIFFNSRHQDDFHNIRLFLNPASGKLEFLPVDFNPSLSKVDLSGKESLLSINYNPLVTRLLLDTQIRQTRDQILRELVNDEKFQQSLWQKYDDLYRQTRGDFYRDPIMLESNLRFEWIVRYEKSMIKTNINTLKQQLQL